MNFEQKTTYKEVTENSDASSKHLKSESKKITTPSKRRRKISKWVENDAIDVGLYRYASSLSKNGYTANRLSHGCQLDPMDFCTICMGIITPRGGENLENNDEFL